MLAHEAGRQIDDDRQHQADHHKHHAGGPAGAVDGEAARKPDDDRVTAHHMKEFAKVTIRAAKGTMGCQDPCAARSGNSRKSAPRSATRTPGSAATRYGSGTGIRSRPRVPAPGNQAPMQCWYGPEGPAGDREAAGVHPKDRPLSGLRKAKRLEPHLPRHEWRARRDQQPGAGKERITRRPAAGSAAG